MKKILLVEDHADTRRLLSRLLAGLRHDVRAAASIASALEMVAEAQSDGKFDLVLSDLDLPDGSGLELMRQLRDKFGLKGIAISGFGMSEDVRNSHEAGFVDHLTKPVNFDALLAAINRATS